MGDGEGQLVVRFGWETDDRDIGRLSVEVASRGFRGRASAWSQDTPLLEFASKLHAYPLDPAEPPVLSRHDDPFLPGPENVGISVRPMGSRGQVKLEVHLRESGPMTMDSRFSHDLRVELPTTYEALRRFGDDLARVARLELDEARLEVEYMLGYT